MAGSRFDAWPDGEMLISSVILPRAPLGASPVSTASDRQRETIVNNESAEIIRMLNTAFAEYTSDRHDYYPAGLRERIDEINTTVYENVNNGVYRSGFAGTQAAYEAAVFPTLDEQAAAKDVITKQWDSVVGANVQ